MPDDQRIRYLRLDSRCTIGAARNLACEEAGGEIIVHWDDDDWMAPWRLRYQVENLMEEEADICGLNRLFFYNPVSDQAWQYIYPAGGKPWVSGNTFCYMKDFWRKNPFPDINVGEDTRFVWRNRSRKLIALQDNSFYVALIHTGNISPKRTSDSHWHTYPSRAIRDTMGEDWDFYATTFPVLKNNE